jgi:hypothetical protein
MMTDFDKRLQEELFGPPMSVKLQGMRGWIKAKPAGELRPGDVTLWNFGYTETILSVTPSKTGKMVTVEIVSDQSGSHHTRKMKADRLVACPDSIQKGA